MTIPHIQIDVIETRSETNGLHLYLTIEEALLASSKDPTIWKIGFTDMNSGERYRLIRTKNAWKQKPPYQSQGDMFYAAERHFTNRDILDLFCIEYL